MKNDPTNRRRMQGRRQRGAVLIVALVLLLVLTILGTAGIQNTVVTERMAGNFRDMALGFEASEAGLRTGENTLFSDATFSSLGFSGSDFSYDVIDGSVSVDPFSASSYGMDVDSADISPDVRQAAQYYVERLPEVQLPNSSIVSGFPDTAPTVQYYRVTSKGYGLSPSVEVILQSTYLK